jgi:poly [ADP-ribose] polymerase
MCVCVCVCACVRVRACVLCSVKRELLEVFKVNRHGEEERYSAFDQIGNRKLLWHGTNVAVVAAIMKSGLRIMPHSGGRVGRGIYLASENCKSASYVSADIATRTGIMFLCEAACGKASKITRDNSSLTAAPQGFDSVHAVGRSEPDPSMDRTMTLDGKEVSIPQVRSPTAPA